MTPPTPEERSLMEKWGISEKEREQAWGSMEITVADLVRYRQDEKAQQEGKDTFTIKIYKDMEAMKEDQYKPAINFAKEDRKILRQKKPPKEGERDWKERNFLAAFRDWAVKNGGSSAVFELKSTPDTSLPFDRLEPHQKEFLLKAKHGKAYYHPSDHANSLGYKEKLPCDVLFMVGVKSFVAIMYRVKEKGQKTFYLVDIDRFLEEEKTSERRSLTEDRCKAIGITCHL
jgi:hypothetical protein